MSIPARVDILGNEFEVRLEDLAERRLCGYTEVHNRLICIDPSLPYDAQVETFYHEVLHAMIQLGGYSEIIRKRKEEALVQHLGMAVATFLSVNPNLPRRKK